MKSNMFLKRLSFGSKECTEELKLECAGFLGLLVLQLQENTYVLFAYSPYAYANLNLFYAGYMLKYATSIVMIILESE